MEKKTEHFDHRRCAARRLASCSPRLVPPEAWRSSGKAEAISSIEKKMDPTALTLIVLKFQTEDEEEEDKIHQEAEGQNEKEK